MYTTQYEKPRQLKESLLALEREYENKLVQNALAVEMGEEIPYPNPELKRGRVDHQGGIDWYFYRERILHPLLYPRTRQLLLESSPGTARNITIMEDNALAHLHDYYNIPRQPIRFSKIIWPANFADLNPIEMIWMRLKDHLQEQIGPQITAHPIPLVLEQVGYSDSTTKETTYIPSTEAWTEYPEGHINYDINSLHHRIRACIEDGGGNNFNFSFLIINIICLFTF